MYNICEYRKAKKELENQNNLGGLGTPFLKSEGAYVFPEAVVKGYLNYIKWMKSYRPKLP